MPGPGGSGGSIIWPSEIRKQIPMITNTDEVIKTIFPFEELMRGNYLNQNACIDTSQCKYCIIRLN